MKLPGIQYKQRGQLARVDPSTYLALGKAKAGIAEAVGDVAGNIYEQESVSEMQEAFLNYTEQMDVWGEGQSAYTLNTESGDKEGSWVNGPKQYEEQERTLRDTISEKLNTPLARRLFNEKANQSNLRNKEAYRGRLQVWRKEHEVAGVYTRLNRQVDAKKFNGARQTLVESYTVGTITESDAAEQLIKINYQEKYYGYSVKVDELETPEDAITYRKQVLASSLKDSDKNKVIAAIDGKYINSHRVAMNEIIIAAETVNGSKQEGYDAGVEHFEKLMRKEPSDMGGDAKFKEQVLGAAHTILNRYKPAVIKQTAENKRYRNADDYNSGRRIAGTKFNSQSHDDSFAFTALNFKAEGKSEFNRNFDEQDPSMRGMTDPAILKNENGAIDKFVDYSARTGHMPKYMKNVLNAALTHNNAEMGGQAATAAYRLMQENPYALWRDSENNDLTQLATLSELMGGSPESATQAFSLWKQSQGISEEQRNLLLGSKKDGDTFFNDNFDTMLEKQYGDRDTVFFNFWTQTTPAVKQQYKVAARKMMDNYTVINKGDLGRGLQSAIISMKGAYHPTTVNDGYTIMKNAPEFAVKDGDKNGGEWLRNQLTADIKSVYGEDIDMSDVTIEPVDKWNPNDPAYKVYLDDDSGMRRMLNVIKFDYELSDEYKENEADLKKLDEANKRTVKVNQLREKWEIDNPPETRKRDRMGIETNPYGVAPKLSGVGKAIVGYGRGIKGQAAAAAISKVEAAKIRKEIEARKAAKPRPVIGPRGPE